MKKIYTTSDYKRWHKNKISKSEKRLRFKKKPIKKPKRKKKKPQPFIPKPVLYAPRDFRLINNTEECLLFFKRLRGNGYLNYVEATYNHKAGYFIDTSLELVEDIDYASISILTAISDDMKYNGIILKTNIPANKKCKDFIIYSGFLDHFVTIDGQKFPKTSKSDLIFFEKGTGKLSENDNLKIRNLVKNVVSHLSGNDAHHLPIKTIILEICGNSIEWSGSNNKFWQLGIKYEDDMVIFTLTDIGQGILETLHKKWQSRLNDFFSNTSNIDILKGAFIKKYGSSAKEANRNKGLPSIKLNAESGAVKNLQLITNDVFLHFGNDDLSKVFKGKFINFNGTFYQWELTNECIKTLTALKWKQEQEQ